MVKPKKIVPYGAHALNLIIDTYIEKSSKDDADSVSNVQILSVHFSWGHTGAP